MSREGLLDSDKGESFLISSFFSVSDFIKIVLLTAALTDHQFLKGKVSRVEECSQVVICMDSK